MKSKNNEYSLSHERAEFAADLNFEFAENIIKLYTSVESTAEVRFANAFAIFGLFNSALAVLHYADIEDNEDFQKYCDADSSDNENIIDLARAIMSASFGGALVYLAIVEKKLKLKGVVKRLTKELLGVLTLADNEGMRNFTLGLELAKDAIESYPDFDDWESAIAVCDEGIFELVY